MDTDLAGANSDRAEVPAQKLRGVLSRSIERGISYGSVGVLIVLIVLPMIMLVYGSFRTVAPGFPDSSFTFSNYDVVATSGFLELLRNSLIIAVGAMVAALVLGTSLAIIIGSTDIRGASLWDSLVIIPGYIAPFIGAIAWSTLLSPNIGYINRALESVGLPAYNVYSYSGMILVMGLYQTPIVYLFVRPSVQRIDKSIMESGRVHGASLGYALRKLFLPLATPALVGAAATVWVLGMGDFGIPAVFGRQDDIQVVATQVVLESSRFPANPNRAAVLGVVLTLLTVVGVGLGYRVIRGRDYTLRGGHATEASRIPIGRWRWLAYLILSGYLVVAVVLPAGAILIGSFMPYMATSFGDVNLTLDNYRYVLGFPQAARALMNTLVLAVGAAVICAFLAVILGYMTSRKTGWWSRVIEQIGNFPLAIPGTVMGLGFLWLWIPVGGGIYGSHWILLFVYVAMGLPFALRPVSSVYLLADPAREEAARVMGGSWAYMMRRVLLPSLSASMLAGAIIVFYRMLRELPASLLLYAQGTVVLSVLVWDMHGEGQYNRLFAVASIIMALTGGVVALGSLLNKYVMR